MSLLGLSVELLPGRWAPSGEYVSRPSSGDRRKSDDDEESMNTDGRVSLERAKNNVVQCEAKIMRRRR